MPDFNNISSLTLVLAENGGGFFNNNMMIFGMVAIFLAYFFIILKPQKKQETDRKDMLSDLKKGDDVQTVGGIMGKVQSVNAEANSVTLEIDSKKSVCIEINRASIYSVVEKKKGGPKGKKTVK